MLKKKSILTIIFILWFLLLIYVFVMVIINNDDSNYAHKLMNSTWVVDDMECHTQTYPNDWYNKISDCQYESGYLYFSKNEVHYILFPYAEEDIEDYFCFFGDDAWIGEGKSKSKYEIKGDTIYSTCKRGKDINKKRVKIISLKNNKLVLKIDGKNVTFVKRNGW